MLKIITRFMVFVSFMLVATVCFAMPSHNNHDRNNHDMPSKSTILFSEGINGYVTSKTALVDVVVNATKLQGIEKNAQKTATRMLNKFLKDVQWYTLYRNQSQLESGAQDVRLLMQSRLTYAQIKILRDNLKNMHTSNMRIKIQLVNYSPNNNEVNATKNAMMIKLYNSTKQYVKLLNKKTNSHYKIMRISFFSSYNYNNDNAEQGRVFSLFMNKSSRKITHADKSSMKALTVSKELQMRVSVTLLQAPSHPHCCKKDSRECRHKKMKDMMKHEKMKDMMKHEKMKDMMKHEKTNF